MQFYIELTSFAPTENLLLSEDALLAAASFSNQIGPSSGSDDRYGGYGSLTVSLVPPSGALSRSAAIELLLVIPCLVHLPSVCRCGVRLYHGPREDFRSQHFSFLYYSYNERVYQLHG